MSLIISANDLYDGRVVYRTNGASWSRDIAAAKIFIEEASAEKALLAAQADANKVIGPYLVPISENQPQHIREKIRLQGPSVPFNATHKVKVKKSS